MEKIKTFSFLFTFDHYLCQFIIFFIDHRDIFFPDRVGIAFISHHRLYGHLLEPQIREMQDIVGKIQIIAGKRSPHIVPLLVSALCQFLELGNDQVITSLSIAEGTHTVIDILAAVQA